MKILTTIAILALILAPLTGCAPEAQINSPEPEAAESDLDEAVEETGEAIEEGAERLAKGTETALEEAGREVKKGERKD